MPALRGRVTRLVRGRYINGWLDIGENLENVKNVVQFTQNNMTGLTSHRNTKGIYLIGFDCVGRVTQSLITKPDFQNGKKQCRN